MARLVPAVRGFLCFRRSPLILFQDPFSITPTNGSSFGRAGAVRSPVRRRHFCGIRASTARMPATEEAFKTGRKVREYRDHRLEWMIKSGGIEVVLAGLRDGNIRFSWPN